MFKSLIAMLLGSESAYQTRKTYREKREPQHIQGARIAAAQAKRDRRAELRITRAKVSFVQNRCHSPLNPRNNPFYINRSNTV